MTTVHVPCAGMKSRGNPSPSDGQNLTSNPELESKCLINFWLCYLEERSPFPGGVSPQVATSPCPPSARGRSHSCSGSAETPHPGPSTTACPPSMNPRPAPLTGLTTHAPQALEEPQESPAQMWATSRGSLCAPAL